LPSMKVSAVLTQTAGRWVAQCEEVDRSGEGTTADEAVACLREALRDYFDVEAVAPPPEPVREAIEIVVLDASPEAKVTR
jgi:hypothetical protein